MITAQTILRGAGEVANEQKEKQDEIEVETAPIELYKFISVDNDTISVDTTLTIYKDYRFNYLREDNFGLLPFANVGKTYNKLTNNFSEVDHIFPLFGARARHYNFMDVEDVFYYNVPTPYTELYFKTVFEQGQTLDALFTINTSNNLNFSIAYMGMRSLGIYQHMLTSSGNFRATLNFHTKNDRYHLKTHFTSQNLFNEENGGLSEQALQQYTAQNPEFEDRSRLEVRFEDAQSTLMGKRFYLDHQYDLVKKDTVDVFAPLAIGHILEVTDKEFHFEQTNANSFFGTSFEDVSIKNETGLEYIYNEAYVEVSNSRLGRLRARGAHRYYNYGYNAILDLETGFIENRLIGDQFSVGGTYATNFNDLNFKAEGMLNVFGEFDGYNLKAGISYLFSEDIFATAAAGVNSHAPNFNFLLYQSDYISYNWQTGFENEDQQSINFEVIAPRFLNLGLEYAQISNYAYFGLDGDSAVKPFQYDGQVNFIKVQGHREVHLGRFALNNTLLYQTVLDGESILKLPDFITRNTLYYSDHWFQSALFLQTGFTLNYFTGYEMNAYDPVLAEFYVQNELEIDGFPTVDFFFNGKIKQARIFFKLEHVDALLDGNNHFSAPNYPYRDFAVRFGLVWNFFM